MLHADFGDADARFDAGALADALRRARDAEFPFGNREPRHWTLLRQRYIELVRTHSASRWSHLAGCARELAAHRAEPSPLHASR
ncbi:MAG: hypothetical protein IPH76_16775 [Xanthomonadales bacterium]|nr:hypothetical protein [Xanthomonadales bacterium]